MALTEYDLNQITQLIQSRLQPIKQEFPEIKNLQADLMTSLLRAEHTPDKNIVIIADRLFTLVQNIEQAISHIDQALIYEVLNLYLQKDNEHLKAELELLKSKAP